MPMVFLRKSCYFEESVRRELLNKLVNSCRLMKLKLILFVFTIIFFSNCKKDGKGCWQAFDPQGYDAPGLILCDKTKAEAEEAFPLYWFYKSGEKKYCWRVQIGVHDYYTWEVPESMANRYKEENGAYQFTKVDCNSFCFCVWHEKRKSKVTGQFSPTGEFAETLLSRDSCNKLFVGRIITIRETADSLITRELAEKHP
jgi:hypothetical protein